MKKQLLIIFAAALIVSCNRKQEMAMKSADKDFILKVANENFSKKKWKNALALYDRLPNLVAGTDDAPNVVFNSAYANYYDKNYKLAGNQFKNFSVSFPQDKRREEAAYMSALCYYQGSMDYNLDQANTESAVNELQDFINSYPNSDRSKNINQLIEELSYKLEFKSYENARQYYKMGDYKAANVSFENVLSDFPGTKLRPKIYNYILKSRYELAMNSIYDLKGERIDNAIAFSKQVEKEIPDSENAKTAVDLRNKLLAEKEKFAKIHAEVEAKKAELTAKQKIENAKETERQLFLEQQKEMRKTEKLRKDSAAAAVKSGTSFKIGK